MIASSESQELAMGKNRDNEIWINIYSTSPNLRDHRQHIYKLTY